MISYPKFEKNVAMVVLFLCFWHYFVLSMVLIDYLLSPALKVQFMKTETEPASEKLYFKPLKMKIVQSKYPHIINTKNEQFLRSLSKTQSKEITECVTNNNWITFWESAVNYVARKFLAFHSTRKWISVCTTSRHWSLYSNKWFFPNHHTVCIYSFHNILPEFYKNKVDVSTFKILNACLRMTCYKHPDRWSHLLNILL